MGTICAIRDSFSMRGPCGRPSVGLSRLQAQLTRSRFLPEVGAGENLADWGAGVRGPYGTRTVTFRSFDRALSPVSHAWTTYSPDAVPSGTWTWSWL